VDHVDPTARFGDEDVVLAREVAEERALGDAGLARDVLDGHVRVAPRREQRHRRLLDLARVALASLLAQIDPGGRGVLGGHQGQG
jgi:hypothetical protein